jgi:peptidoglycan/LPS O-acetylase OafA/YrhL
MLSIMRHNASDHFRSSYRADIDGLRAIAVMAVVLYHTSVPGFGGGFVGVDVFFVISGFLITNLVGSGVKTKSFSFSEFYERRARRLAPALAVVLLSTCLAAFIYFTPIDFEQFSKSLFATSIFLSNIFFMRQTANYFDVDSALKPLLHTWSLAVEEQFYLLYPAILVLLLRTARSYVIHWIIALLLISLAASSIGVWYAPQAAFYLLPSRAWELLLGAAVSLCPLTVPFERYLRELLAVIGLGCIGLSVWLLTSQSPFPGLNALLPCIGTALILWSSGDGLFVTRLLSLRYMVFIGLISYSLYLWHWPIIIFWKYVVNEQMSWGDVGVVILASISLAALSWKFVEQPFRRGNSVLKLRGRQVFFATGSAIALFATIGIVGVVGNGLPQRLSPQVLKYAAGKLDGNPREVECLERPERVLRGDFCAVGSRDTSKPHFLVWGDSLTDSWMPVFDDMARAEHLTGWFAEHQGCLPLVGVRQFQSSTSGGCQEFTEFVANAVARNDIHEVVLISRWSWYIYGYEGVSEIGLHAPIIDSMRSGDSAAEGVEARQRIFERGVQQTLALLIKNRARVWIVDEVAGQLMDIPTYLARNASSGRRSEGRLRSEVIARQAFVRDVFNRNQSDLVRRVDPNILLCPVQESRCHIEADGMSLYLDTAHLSTFGARTVGSIFNPMFKAMEQRRANE